MTQETNNPSQTPAPPTNWYGEIPADKAELRNWIANKQFKDQLTALESYHNFEKLQGIPSEHLLRLPKDGDAEGWGKLWGRLGRPETHDQYELPLPEGDDGSLAKEAAKWFHEQGVSKAAAQGITKKWNDHIAAIVKQQTEAAQADSMRQLNDLKTEWGNDYEKHAELSRRARNTIAKDAGFSDDDINNLESSIGTAKMLKLFAKLGGTTTEHPFASNAERPNGFGLTPDMARTQLDEARVKRIKGELSDEQWNKIIDRFGPIASP